MIKIITDSASDILQDEAKQLNISVLPLKTIFSDGEYLDGVNLSHQQFYEKIRDLNEIPKTSQVNIYDFSKEYKKFKDDDIIVITMSAKLSGTCQSAMIASEEFDNVHVVDSGSVTIGEQILVRYALELIKKGLSVNEIVDELNEQKKNICVFGLLDTLEYLKKGGRISSTQAFVGNILSIKPVCGIVDGAVKVYGKARGYKNGHIMLNNIIKDDGGIDDSKPFACAYSGLNVELLTRYLDNNQHMFQMNVKDIPIRTIGCTIGTHIGPDTIALAFFKNN